MIDAVDRPLQFLVDYWWGVIILALLADFFGDGLTWFGRKIARLGGLLVGGRKRDEYAYEYESSVVESKVRGISAVLLGLSFIGAGLKIRAEESVSAKARMFLVLLQYQILLGKTEDNKIGHFFRLWRKGGEKKELEKKELEKKELEKKELEKKEPKKEVSEQQVHSGSNYPAASAYLLVVMLATEINGDIDLYEHQILMRVKDKFPRGNYEQAFQTLRTVRDPNMCLELAKNSLSKEEKLSVYATVVDLVSLTSLHDEEAKLLNKICYHFEINRRESEGIIGAFFKRC